MVNKEVLKVFKNLKEEMSSTLELDEFILCLLERHTIGFLYNDFYDYHNFEEVKDWYLEQHSIEEIDKWFKESKILLAHNFKHLSLEYSTDDYGDELVNQFEGVIELDGIIYIGESYEDSYILDTIRVAKVEKKIIEEILYS